MAIELALINQARKQRPIIGPHEGDKLRFAGIRDQILGHHQGDHLAVTEFEQYNVNPVKIELEFDLML